MLVTYCCEILENHLTAIGFSKSMLNLIKNWLVEAFQIAAHTKLSRGNTLVLLGNLIVTKDLAIFLYSNRHANGQSGAGLPGLVLCRLEYLQINPSQGDFMQKRLRITSQANLKTLTPSIILV